MIISKIFFIINIIMGLVIFLMSLGALEKFKNKIISSKIYLIIFAVYFLIASIASSFDMENYRSKVLNLIDKNLETTLLTQDIDYFKFKLIKNPNGNLCILLYTREQFPELNFQMGNRYYLVGMYGEAVKKYVLAIDEVKQWTDSQDYLWKVYCNLALAYNANGDKDKAKEYAEECLSINLNVDAPNKLIKRLEK
ncbi:MAG: tetratricopeptide repeat protein [Candidatus Omnitrophota bacterium]